MQNDATCGKFITIVKFIDHEGVQFFSAWQIASLTGVIVMPAAANLSELMIQLLRGVLAASAMNSFSSLKKVKL